MKKNKIGKIIIWVIIVAVLFVAGVIHEGGEYLFPNITEAYQNFMEERFGVVHLDPDATAWEADSQQRSAVYNAIYDQLSNYNTVVNIKMDSDDVDYVEDQFSKVVGDHPELFWLTGSASIKWSGAVGVYTYTIKPEIEGDMANIPSMYTEVMAQVDQIVSQAKTQGSTYNQVKYVHDYIVNNVSYNEDAAKIITLTNNRKNTNNACTVYGALINKSAVCEGYAKTFKICMDQLGIPCNYLAGTATNSQGTANHAWNSVNIDGNAYYVDCTWDDPVGAKQGYIGRDYFCVSYAQISKDHTEDAETTQTTN